MRATFEVIHKDLLGRIGTLSVNGKAVETPAFVPVISPTNQVLPAREIGERFRCGMVITNAYIMRKHLADRAVAEGVHSVIGFDGLVCTDSGGYQVLEYGEVGVGPSEIALFQESIGTDIAIPLDRPTGLLNRAMAAESVEQTLRNIRQTFESLGEGRRAAWAGPIQGGLYKDLLEYCIRSLADFDFDLYALGSPTPLMENYRYDRLVMMMADAKLSLPADKLLHLFGAGHPMMFAYAVALGYDTFDSASYILFAKQDRYMLPTGTTRLEALEYLPCECEVCSTTSAKELRSLEDRERCTKLATHNLSVCFKEVEMIKQAIVEGRLMELLELRARSHPSLAQALVTILNRQPLVETMELHTPLSKRRAIALYSHLSLLRPEVRRAIRMLSHVKPNPHGLRAAVLIPHRVAVVKRMEEIESVIGRLGFPDCVLMLYASPFGVIPAALAKTYPFSQVIFPRSLLEEAGEMIFDLSAEMLRRSGVEEIYLVRWKGEPSEEFLEALKGFLLQRDPDMRTTVVEL